MFHESFEQNTKEKSETLAEEELSPEVLEQIMAKVQDINKPGTAYNSVDYTQKNVQSILSSGLLGMADKTPMSDNARRKKWVKLVRNPDKDLRKTLHFNIVGRTLLNDRDETKTEMERSYWAKRSLALTVIFDLGSFKERTDYYSSDKKFPSNLLQSREFVTDMNPASAREFDGFELKWRVDPRYFRGLILGTLLMADYGYISGDRYMSNEKINDRVDKISKQMLEIDKNRPERILPIYDNHGNLLWPKKMSYGEVKKMVQEKEENK